MIITTKIDFDFNSDATSVSAGPNLARRDSMQSLQIVYIGLE